MDENVLLLIGLGIGFIVGAIIFYVIGKWGDLDWRCLFLRRLRKKNYIVLNISQGDGHNFDSMIVNADEDIARVGDHLWVIEKKAMYRKDKPEKRSKIDKQDIHWTRQGAPNVFVDRENLSPLRFKPEDALVRSNEVSATLQGWIVNQIAKNALGKDKVQMLVLLTMAVCFFALVFAFMGMTTSSDTLKVVNEIKNSCGSGVLGALNNGTITITPR